MLTRRDVGMVAALVLAGAGLQLGALRVIYSDGGGQAERIARTLEGRPVMRKLTRHVTELDKRMQVVEEALPDMRASVSAASVCADAISEQLSARGGWRKQTTDTLVAQAEALAVIARCACGGTP